MRFSFGSASAGFGLMSNATTFSAPRSTSISTNLRPTNPMPPVTTQFLGTGGNPSDVVVVVVLESEDEGVLRVDFGGMIDV